MKCRDEKQSQIFPFEGFENNVLKIFDFQRYFCTLLKSFCENEFQLKMAFIITASKIQDELFFYSCSDLSEAGLSYQNTNIWSAKSSTGIRAFIQQFIKK